jgi:hypothetical protein
VLCDLQLQAAEFALTTADLTLGFDATTQEGVHINSVHLSSKDTTLVIAVDQLPGGTAQDYADHIVEAINNLATTYCSLHAGNTYEQIRRKIVGNITNTMSDRAAVNHATITKLEELWGEKTE